MAARDSVAPTVRDDAAGRGRGVRAETPPVDYWRRWSDIPETLGAASRPAQPTTPAAAAPSLLAGAPTAATTTEQPREPATVSAALAEMPVAGSSSPYRILIVEDDRSQALFAQSVLHGAGMQARVEMASAAVPQAIEDYRPDLILMDLHMPDLDGIGLTTMIRQQPRHQLLPIVFLTGDPDPERQFEVLDSGADDFLTKPIRPRHLIAAVSNRIRRARQQAQPAAGLDSIDRHPETGLPPRSQLMHWLGERLGQPEGGLMFVEIASALGLRERYGYTAFERLMVQAAQRLAQVAQPFPLAQLNDNSFLLVADSLDAAALLQLGRDMRQALSSTPFQVRADESLQLRCAIGVARLDAGFADAESALEAAERTALQARLSPEGVLAHAPDTAERDPLQAVEGQFEPAYRPIVAVAGGEPVPCEVLLRLRQPDGRLLEAAQVIPAADAAGRISDLDQQVLEHALDLLQHYQHAQPPLRLFVSQSWRTLARDAFAGWLLQSLAQRRLAGTALVIDLALDDALLHGASLQGFCARLRPAGVQFCLSQFHGGTEAASLLGRLPLNYVRVGDREAGPGRREELRTAISLARRHGLQVIGPRVERGQAAGGPDFIQGGLVSSISQALDLDIRSAVL